MSRANDADRLRHMLEHSREAMAMTQGKERAELDRDRMLELALVRLMEIVGEAANRVSASTQERFSKIPWPEIIGLRNRLIHGYDAVDHDILWTILKQDLPSLVQELERILPTVQDL